MKTKKKATTEDVPPRLFEFSWIPRVHPELSIKAWIGFFDNMKSLTPEERGEFVKTMKLTHTAHWNAKS